MKFDRGFIKWQPFNSVIPGSLILNNLNSNKPIPKPTLFPEEIEKINAKIIESYYSHNLIEITIYERNKIIKLKTTIVKLNNTNHTLNLANNKTISFNQILNIKDI